MSLQTQPIPAIPKMTVQVAQAAFRKGNTYMQMRNTLGTFFTNDHFRDLYPYDGQPAYDPWRLALVSIMQFAENLTDRQAATDGIWYGMLGDGLGRVREAWDGALNPIYSTDYAPYGTLRETVGVNPGTP